MKKDRQNRISRKKGKQTERQADFQGRQIKEMQADRKIKA
jgi:hypothetical protein